MWSALAYVTTGVSLVGFIAAVAAWLSRAALVRREELIQSASEKDRAKLIEASLESFRVSTSGLTREQKYQLAIEQIHARERRFKYLGSVVSLIAILVAALAAYAIAKTEIAAPTSGVPAEPTQITQRQPPPPQPPKPTSPFTDWQLVRHDEFASESGWWTGEQHDPKLQYFRVDVQGGRYRWALGIGDIPWDKFVPSPYPTAYEFAFALDYRIVTGSIDETVISINFGKGGNDEYVLSAARSVFYLSRLDNGASQQLTSVASTRRRSEWQRLGVVVANQVIRGYVDSTMLLERRDASFSGGTIGLSIGSFAPRDEVVVEIDNMEFRRPADAIR